MRWPPVPPPASRTFIASANAECGMRNAEWQRALRFVLRPSSYTPHSAFRIPRWVHSAFRIPHSALSRPRTPPPAPNADQDTSSDEGDEETRPPVRDERQRDAGRGQERQAHADV